MTSKGQITKIASRDGVDARVVERDYVLVHAVALISSSTAVDMVGWTAVPSALDALSPPVLAARCRNDRRLTRRGSQPKRHGRAREKNAKEALATARDRLEQLPKGHDDDNEHGVSRLPGVP